MAFDYKKEYKNSIGLLYGIAFTIKMSYKGTHKKDYAFSVCTSALTMMSLLPLI